MIHIIVYTCIYEHVFEYLYNAHTHTHELFHASYVDEIKPPLRY